MNARKSDDFISDVERQFEWYAFTQTGKLPNVISLLLKPLVNCWDSIHVSALLPDFRTRVCENGGLLSCFVHFKSTFSFTKYKVMTFYCAAQCMGIVICRIV